MLWEMVLWELVRLQQSSWVEEAGAFNFLRRVFVLIRSISLNVLVQAMWMGTEIWMCILHNTSLLMGRAKCRPLIMMRTMEPLLFYSLTMVRVIFLTERIRLDWTKKTDGALAVNLN